MNHKILAAALMLSGCAVENQPAKSQPDLFCHHARTGYDLEVRANKITRMKQAIGGGGEFWFIDQWGIEQKFDLADWNANISCREIPKIAQ